MVRCKVHLYYAPGWELGEGSPVAPETLPALGAEVAARCERAAVTLTALLARGWHCRLDRYDVVAEKSCDRAAAMLDFLRAGLDPVALALEEVDAAGPA